MAKKKSDAPKAASQAAPKPNPELVKQIVADVEARLQPDTPPGVSQAVRLSGDKGLGKLLKNLVQSAIQVAGMASDGALSPGEITTAVIDLVNRLRPTPGQPPATPPAPAA